MPSPFWANLPEAEITTGRIPVLNPSPGKPVTGFPLASTITGVYVHWIGRTVPCVGSEGCTHCQAGGVRRWKGYLPVTDATGTQRAILEFSQGAANKLTHLVNDGLQLLQVGLTLRRKGRRPNGEMTVEVNKEQARPKRTPRGFDPKPTLLRLWGFDPQALDKNVLKGENDG
jgi:hypothetical protein